MGLQQQILRLRSKAWSGWPAKAYAQKRYQHRLLAVQDHFANCLDLAAPGRQRVISVCAGDGRDVITTLCSHNRRNDVKAWLVELDCQSVANGIQHAAREGLQDIVRFMNTDATNYATYRGIAPADIVLVCGVWGHVPAHERGSLVCALSQLCRPAGTVIWTRGISTGHDRLHEIEALFPAPEWQCLRTSVTDGTQWAVASYRYDGPAHALPDGGRIFNFQRRAGQ